MKKTLILIFLTLNLTTFSQEKIADSTKVDGWQKSTAGINKFNDLPENAKKYIQILEDLMETNISIVSTGPDRKETIDINGTLSNF